MRCVAEARATGPARWCGLCSAVAARCRAGAAAVRMFTDVTAAAGIRFRHISGAFGKKYLPETMGSGVAFLDADGDGWQDLFFVNSTTLARAEAGAGHALPALYRNNADGTFTDVTRAGRARRRDLRHGRGGRRLRQRRRRRHLRHGARARTACSATSAGWRFDDVTARAGVGDPGFSTSAAWFDYDRDGKLDLFVANYVEWSIEKDLFCTLDGKTKSYCTPESYKGQSATLYRNRGDGTFEDVTTRGGPVRPDVARRSASR